MALDVRRYQQARDKKPSDNFDVSISTFPALATLCVGVFVIIVGVILMVAFGVPKNLSENLKPLSGVAVVGLGLFLSVLGMIVAIYLKRKNMARKRSRKRAEQRRQKEQQQLDGEQRHTAVTSGHHQQQVQYEPQQLCVPAARGHHTKVQPTTDVICSGNTYLQRNGQLTVNNAVPTAYS